MSNYVFTGRLVPDLCDINLAVPVLLQMHAVDAGFECDVIISICNSQVSATIKNFSGNFDLLSLRNYVRDAIRTFVDTLNYIHGCEYDIEITTVVELNTGQSVVFNAGIPELFEVQSERPLAFDKVWLLARDSQPLRNSLANLREAIRQPNDTGFFCFRAIESIRQHFYEPEDRDKDKPSWERLRNSLRIDRSWIDALTQSYEAGNQRHGKYPYMSGENRVSAMLHTWKVVDRFCIYLDNGAVQLAEEIEELRLN